MLDEDTFHRSKVWCKRIIFARSSIEVIPKTNCDDKTALSSSLLGEDESKSSIPILYEFDSMKEEIRVEYSSALSVSDFSSAKEITKMIKESGLDANPKFEGKEFSPKEMPRKVSP